MTLLMVASCSCPHRYTLWRESQDTFVSSVASHVVRCSQIASREGMPTPYSRARLLVFHLIHYSRPRVLFPFTVQDGVGRDDAAD